jgi:hypothetical protein
MPLILKNPNEQALQRQNASRTNLQTAREGGIVHNPVIETETVEESSSDNFTIVKKSSAFLRDMLAAKRNNK